MGITVDIKFDMLIQTLQLLGANYDEQVDLLPAFVHIPDELALIFDDVHIYAEEILREGLITNQQKKDIDMIRTLFDQM